MSNTVTTDRERVNFLAELMNLSVILEMGGNLSKESRRHLTERSIDIAKRYEFYRREIDTPIAFRLAVDDAMKAAIGGRNDG